MDDMFPSYRLRQEKFLNGEQGNGKIEEARFKKGILDLCLTAKNEDYGENTRGYKNREFREIADFKV